MYEINFPTFYSLCLTHLDTSNTLTKGFHTESLFVVPDFVYHLPLKLPRHLIMPPLCVCALSQPLRHPFFPLAVMASFCHISKSLMEKENLPHH